MQCLRFFERGLRNTFCFMSFMNSLDLNKMICFPFQYAEYCQWKNVLRRLTLGVILSFAFAHHELFRLVSIYNTQDIKVRSKYRIILSLENIFVETVVMIACSALTVRKSVMTRKVLWDSAQIGESRKNRDYKQKLFIFSLIPLLNIAICFWPDMCICFIHLIETVKAYNGDTVKDDNEMMSTLIIIRNASFTVISFFSLIVYFLLFPSIRKKLFCQTNGHNH